MPKKKKKDEDWIQEADKEMKEEGTEGTFTKKAERKGKSVQQYATEVIKKLKGNTKNKSEVKLLRQAVFAKNMKKINK
jgi:hypothetical protein